jgi:hypothetical protein
LETQRRILLLFFFIFTKNEIREENLNENYFTFLKYMARTKKTSKSPNKKVGSKKKASAKTKPKEKSKKKSLDVPLTWNEFRKKQKGKGHSITELSRMYREMGGGKKSTKSPKKSSARPRRERNTVPKEEYDAGTLCPQDRKRTTFCSSKIKEGKPRCSTERVPKGSQVSFCKLK